MRSGVVIEIRVEQYCVQLIIYNMIWYTVMYD